MIFVQTVWRHHRRRLPRAWDAIKAWEQTFPTRSRTPVPFEVVEALAAAALSWALENHTHCHALVAFSILIRLSFFGLLRAAEMLGLCIRDCLIADPSDEVQSVVLALRDPQNRSSFGKH